MAAKNPVVSLLTAQQASAYVAEVKKNDDLFTLIRESFKLKFDRTKGITKDEMDQVVDGSTDPDLKDAMKGVKLLGESRTVLTLDNASKNGYRKALVVYGRRRDGKYDVLVVYATQVKELAKDKLMACGLDSVCAGILVGVTTAVSLSAASGIKAACDYSQEIPNVLCGYILQELVQKGVLQISSDNNGEFMIN